MKGGLSVGILGLMFLGGIYEILVDQYYLGGGIWLFASLILFPPIHEGVFGKMLWPAQVSLVLYIVSFLGGLFCMQGGA